MYTGSDKHQTILYSLTYKSSIPFTKLTLHKNREMTPNCWTEKIGSNVRQKIKILWYTMHMTTTPRVKPQFLDWSEWELNKDM